MPRGLIPEVSDVALGMPFPFVWRVSLIYCSTKCYRRSRTLTHPQNAAVRLDFAQRLQSYSKSVNFFSAGFRALNHFLATGLIRQS